MTESLDRIVQNAHEGRGACTDCPAHHDTKGRYVNPGLINPDADLMFLTIDPSHRTDWSKYASWEEYNAEKAPMFIHHSPGGRALRKLLTGIPGVTIEDIWLADAIKCPVNNDLAGDIDSDAAFQCCSGYLQEEIHMVDPEVIVTLGNDPAEQLLNGYYGLDVGSIRAGTRDAATTFDVQPPVVVSPHWSNGWLGRHQNREKVRDSIRGLLNR